MIEIKESMSDGFIKISVIPDKLYIKWLFNLICWTMLQFFTYKCIEVLGLSATKFKLILIFSIILSLILIRVPHIDCFYVFRGHGVQISSIRGILLFPLSINKKYMENKTFIPLDNIFDIVINEGFAGLEVIFYMCIIMKNSKQLVLIFPVCKSIILKS